MKKMIHFILSNYVRLGLLFYFKKITVYGKENIPRKKAVLFTANHQNAFLDALIIAVTNGRFNHFLARASIFGNPITDLFLSLLNMHPVYRVRDGFQTISKNRDTFEEAYKLMAKNEALLIFPEGNHGFDRRLRPLSKGFARIAFGTLDNFPETDVYIVPVGLNYSDHKKVRSAVGICYGEPIDVKLYYDPNNVQDSSRQLRSKLISEMRKLTTHIDSESNYQEILDQLHSEGFDFADPKSVNERILEISNGNASALVTNESTSRHADGLTIRLITTFYFLINLIPIMIWRYVKSKIKDEVFTGSLKFICTITVFPIYYLIVSLAVFTQSDIYAAVTTLIILLISMPVYKKLKDE